MPLGAPTGVSPHWRVLAFASRQRTAPGQRYFWDNRRRTPAQVVVVQATHEGAIQYRGPDGPLPVRPGSIMLFSYGEASNYGSPAPLDAPYICSWVNLQGAGLPEHIAALRARFASVRDVGMQHPLFAELEELIALAHPAQAATPTAMAAAVHTFIMHLFEHAEESHRRRLSPVQRAVESITRYPHLATSLDAVAHRFGCTREHLSRTFHHQLKQTPAAFIADAKRRRAQRLLRDSDLPLAEVARQSGFASPRTMARQLRLATGKTPSAFRAAR